MKRKAEPCCPTPESPTPIVNPASDVFRLEAQHFDLEEADICRLANKLQVDKRVALTETLAFAALRKLQSKEGCTRKALVEIWDT